MDKPIRNNENCLEKSLSSGFSTKTPLPPVIKLDPV